MVYDFKKAFKQFYQPKRQPEIITIPEMRFISVAGQGNPNTDGGTYSEAVALLYALSYAIKMSY